MVRTVVLRLSYQVGELSRCIVLWHGQEINALITSQGIVPAVGSGGIENACDSWGPGEYLIGRSLDKPPT
jgi:hypothetical protein